ncbi:MAG TPA: Asp23/Gls24 family envelope stress response protein [Anaerolineae bacterium]|nr:Asp23/Gls24 family envelope stress response protein [Anaerolineae bacterium]
MMDEKGQNSGRAPGTTTIAPSVLITIARLTALSVPGVAMMASIPGGVNRLIKRGSGEGVRIEIDEDAVAIDLYLILARNTNVRKVSRKVQAEVGRAIEDMVGMQIKRIDIHIEDIDYDYEVS